MFSVGGSVCSGVGGSVCSVYVGSCVHSQRSCPMDCAHVCVA